MKRISKVSGPAIALSILVIAGTLALQAHQISAGPVHHATASSHVWIIGQHLAKAFPSWGDLKGASTLIVVGTAESQKAEGGSTTTAPWTATTIRVESVLQGKMTASHTVLVRQVGGQGPDGSVWVPEDFPLLTVGSRYLLFLTPSPVANEFYPVGAPQGVFTVNTEGNVDSYTAQAARIGVALHSMPFDQVIQAVRATPATQATP